MSDTHEPDWEDVDDDLEGHEVPADLTVIHEIEQWRSAQSLGPNETGGPV